MFESIVKFLMRLYRLLLEYFKASPGESGEFPLTTLEKVKEFIKTGMGIEIKEGLVCQKKKCAHEFAFDEVEAVETGKTGPKGEVYMMYKCPDCGNDLHGFDFETTIGLVDVKPDEHGYYGARGTTILNGKTEIVGYMTFTESRITRLWQRLKSGKIVPKSGTFLFRFEFDPNNGHIYRQSCNPEYIDCSGIEQIPYDRPEDNPDYEKYLELL